MLDEVVRPQSCPPAADLDDRDPRESEGERQETSEREIEEREERDLEDPVVAHEERPRGLAAGIAVAEDLRTVRGAGFAAAGELTQDRSEDAADARAPPPPRVPAPPPPAPPAPPPA